MKLQIFLSPRTPQYDPLVLEYQPLNHSVSRKYFSLLTQFCQRGEKVDKDLSYWNFLLESEQKRELVDSLQWNLDELRKDPRIKMSYRVSVDDDQIKLNEIHERFEYYLKKINAGHYHPVPDDSIYAALLQINLLIHQIENFHRIEQQIEVRGKDYVDCAFGFCFENDEFLNLEDADFDLFSLGRPFGSLSCGYNTSGKNLIHIMNDHDIELVRQGKVTPQRTFSTEGYVWFGPDIEETAERRRLDDWWDCHRIDQYGYSRQDKKNALGLIPLAELLEPEEFQGKSRWDKLMIINRYGGVKDVRVVE